ncbi:protease [Pendulispora brunnea]|uniref:Protease n=1 Tax=Pendulispora brunnea TaxID=2905690 RepID=A0ABZ2KN53_9BACT
MKTIGSGQLPFGVLAWFGIVMGTVSCAKTPPEATPAAEAPVSSAPAPAPAEPAAPVPATATPAASATAPASPALECSIRIEPKIKLGQSAKVHFRLAQRAAQTVYVLNWRTPLEGLRGDDFSVVRDGTEIPYRGPMMKRGNPSAESYLALEASKPLEADVNLALAYDFSKPGHYRITFRGKIWDLVTQQSEIPRPLDKHQPVQLTCASVETDVAP